MTGRPEGSDGGFEWRSYESTEDFEPYRPSDASTGEVPAESAAPTADSKPARWWTEDVDRPWRAGEHARAKKATGGTFVTHVPKGTRGEVLSTRSRLLGGDSAVVRFENGYTEEVSTNDIERERPWWL